MVAQINLRLVNHHTGEVRELNKYSGNIFQFVFDEVEERGYEGDWMLLDDEVVALFLAKGASIMKKRGYYWDDLIDVYGIEGFLKELTNRAFYIHFGWVMEMMAEW